MKKFFILIGVVIVSAILAHAVLAAPAAVTQTAAAVNKNLPPYNRDAKINDAVSDLTKTDIPAIILNLNQVITNAPYATNVTLVVTLSPQTITITNVYNDTTNVVKVYTNVTGTAVATPQYNY